MVYAEFLERKTVKMGFKIFSVTRFTYAFLLVHSVLLHLRVLSGIGEWPDFVAVKANIIKGTKVANRARKEAEFDEFESALYSTETKKKGKAVVALLRPLS